MLTKKKLLTTLALAIGIVILLNIIGDRFFTRLDFTEDRIYSLSDATLNILDSLTEPVTVTAYFSENLPPNVAKVREDFRDMLIEYNNRSNGMVVYEFVNPNKDQQTEMEAQQNGIQPVMINVRERDQMKQQRAYLGAIVQMGEQKEVIPFIQPGAAIEYELSSNIKKIAIKEKPKVGFMNGNGEPILSAMQQLTSILSVTHDVKTFALSDTSGVPDEFNTIAIVAPKDSIPENYFKYLDDFLSRGGRIFVALNRVDGNLQNLSGEAVSTGLAEWLAKYGIEIGTDFVIDAHCSSIMVRQQQGFFQINTPVKFPYVPIATNFADHPITKGLEEVLFPYVSSVKYTGSDSSMTVTDLVFSSDRSAIKPLPVYFDIQKNWRASDFTESKVPLAIALEGNFNGANTKMVVVGDGDFAVNGEGQKAQQLQPDNINLFVNSIDWLSDDTGLNELRTKGITSRPLNAQLEDGTKALIRYLNFLLPIFLVIGYGFFRFRINKAIRNKMASIDYE